jgi:hypothetical protein
VPTPHAARSITRRRPRRRKRREAAGTRHLEDGFAVRFNELQRLDQIERMIVYNWNHEGAAAAPLLCHQ